MSVAETENNIGQVLRKQGKISEAMEMYQKANEIKTRTLGESHPSFALTLGNIAKIHLLQGEKAKARALLEKSRSTFQSSLGQEHDYTQWAVKKLCSLDT